MEDVTFPLTIKHMKIYLQANKKDDSYWSNKDIKKLKQKLILQRTHYNKSKESDTRYDFVQIKKYYDTCKLKNINTQPKNIQHVLYYLIKQALKIILKISGGKSCLNKQCNQKQCEKHQINWIHYIDTKILKNQEKSSDPNIQERNTNICKQKLQEQPPIQNHEKLANFSSIQEDKQKVQIKTVRTNNQKSANDENNIYINNVKNVSKVSKINENKVELVDLIDLDFVHIYDHVQKQKRPNNSFIDFLGDMRDPIQKLW